jgi:DNA-binding response OmpR family regulator
MDNDAKILIVEDEDAIREFIALNLKMSGFMVEEAATGEAALEKLGKIRFDVAVLDVMLPGMNGYEVCTKARKICPDISIIMLTAKTQDMDKITGLEMGADDYMTKPFNPMELIARIRAVLRRFHRTEERPVLQSGLFRFDSSIQKFFKGENAVDLTPRELALIKVLMQNEGKAMSRDELLNSAWGETFFGDTKTLDVHIRRLREKIEDKPSEPAYIVTIRGFGYMWRKQG